MSTRRPTGTQLREPLGRALRPIGTLVVGVAARGGRVAVQLQVYALGQQARDALDVHRLVLLVDLAQRVRDDAEIAAQLAHHGRDLLGVCQHLDRLGVGVVAQAKRPLYLARELSGILLFLVRCELICSGYKLSF